MQLPMHLSEAAVYDNDKSRRSGFVRRSIPAVIHRNIWTLLKLGLLSLLVVVALAWTFASLPRVNDLEDEDFSLPLALSFGRRAGANVQHETVTEGEVERTMEDDGSDDEDDDDDDIHREELEQWHTLNTNTPGHTNRETREGANGERGVGRGVGLGMWFAKKEEDKKDDSTGRRVGDNHHGMGNSISTVQGGADADWGVARGFDGLGVAKKLVGEQGNSMATLRAEEQHPGGEHRTALKKGENGEVNDGVHPRSLIESQVSSNAAIQSPVIKVEQENKRSQLEEEMGRKKNRADPNGRDLIGHHLGGDIKNSVYGGGSGKVLTNTWQARQRAVTEAFIHAWEGYKKFAWGYDELAPLARHGLNNLGGLGATIIDGLDTAMLMGLSDVVDEAGGWVEHELEHRLMYGGDVNVFETTIRALGGLLSAFFLRDKGYSTAGPEASVYLDKAKVLAGKLMGAFRDSSTAVPLSDVHLATGHASASKFDMGSSSTAEAATLGLELWYVSQLTGDSQFGDAAVKLMRHLSILPKTDGLVPIFISPSTGDFQGDNIRLGSRGDSYYEYLVKMWMQQGGARPGGEHVSWLRKMYDEAMTGVKTRLLSQSFPRGLTYVAELPSGPDGGKFPKMDHLVCFLPGTLALGATRGMPLKQAQAAGLLSQRDVDDLKIAEELTHTCFEMYNVTLTGLAPEIAYFNTGQERGDDPDPGTRRDAWYGKDIMIHSRDRHNLLRPETVESLFYLYRITGDVKYREWGWKIFQAFENYTKVETGGYSSLQDVTRVPPLRRDKMETFFLGETLKYLYLLFGDPGVMPLDSVVFNTEAHPLPILENHGDMRAQSI